MWFFNECIIKWKFFKQSFCFLFIPKTPFYMTYISFLYHTKIFNFDDITNENNEDHNKKWPYIPDHPYHMFIIGFSELRKTNALLTLIREQDNDELIDKIYLHAKC